MADDIHKNLPPSDFTAVDSFFKFKRKCNAYVLPHKYHGNINIGDMNTYSFLALYFQITMYVVLNTQNVENAIYQEVHIITIRLPKIRELHYAGRYLWEIFKRIFWSFYLQTLSRSYAVCAGRKRISTDMSSHHLKNSSE